MTATQADALRVLALPDDEFFSLTPAARTALQTTLAKALGRKPFSKPPGAPTVAPPELRVVSVPSMLDWQHRDSLPMLLAEQRSGQRAWAVHPGQNRLFVLSNLSTGVVDVRAPLDEGRRMPILPPSGSEAAPSALNATATLTGVLQYNLLRWFTREQANGRFAVTAIEVDQASNTAVASGVNAPPDTARRRVQRLKVEALPLPAPLAPGVRLTMPAGVEAAAPAQMQAELSLPRSQTTSVAVAGDAGPALVVAATLMFVQLDNLMPELLHLTLPARQAAALGPDGERVETVFRIELRAALAGRRMSGRYQAYLIVGSTVTGPQPITFALP